MMQGVSRYSLLNMIFTDLGHPKNYRYAIFLNSKRKRLSHAINHILKVTGHFLLDVGLSKQIKIYVF